MDNQVTFGSFGLHALSKLQQSRVDQIEAGDGEDKTLHRETEPKPSVQSHDVDVTSHASAQDSLYSDDPVRSSSVNFGPNSFAGKRGLIQLLRQNQRRASAFVCKRTQPRPIWHRHPMFTANTRPPTKKTTKCVWEGMQHLRVHGEQVKMTARTKPLLWLSLRVNWSKSGFAQKEALRRIVKFTRERAIMRQRQPRSGYRSESRHMAWQKHKRRGKSKARPRFTIACDFCTFINERKRGGDACVMCGANLPDPAAASSLDKLLDCGLTMRQLIELQTRDITEEDFEVLCILDEAVPKKTLDKKELDKFPRTKVTQGGIDCGICQCELEMGELMTSLPCKHRFHTECINQWLLKYNNSCPFKCSLHTGAAEA